MQCCCCCFVNRVEAIDSKKTTYPTSLIDMDEWITGPKKKTTKQPKAESFHFSIVFLFLFFVMFQLSCWFSFSAEKNDLFFYIFFVNMTMNKKKKNEKNQHRHRPSINQTNERNVIS